MTADLFDIFRGAAPLPPFVVIEVPGMPRGKQAHEVQVLGRSKSPPFRYMVKSYLPAETVDYQNRVAAIARTAMAGKTIIPREEWFWMRLFIMMPVRPSWSKKEREAAYAGTIEPVEKPDDDNVSKALDALNGVVWADDCQRSRSLIVKEYGEHPGIIIEVYRPI